MGESTGGRYYDVTRKVACCDAVGGFDIGTRGSCVTATLAEQALAARHFRIDYSAVPDAYLFGGQAEWQELFENAWHLMVENLDLLEWSMCYFEEILDATIRDFFGLDTFQYGDWELMFEVVRLRILATEDRNADLLVTLEASADEGGQLSVPVPGVYGSSIIFRPVRGFWSVDDRGLLVFEPSTTASLLTQWRLAAGNTSSMLCVAAYVGSILIHELMHTAGETHLRSENQNCQFQWAVQNGWLAGVLERYDGCFGPASACSSTGVYGTRDQWGDASARNFGPMP